MELVTVKKQICNDGIVPPNEYTIGCVLGLRVKKMYFRQQIVTIIKPKIECLRTYECQCADDGKGIATTLNVYNKEYAARSVTLQNLLE